MFQGNRQARLLNVAPFPFDPRRLDFVILTHAHLDHSGLLPRLDAAGFSGPIYTTDATRDLVGVLLPDSAYLQQLEAQRALRHHREFTAAYDLDDARAVLRKVRTVSYETTFEPAAGVRARLRDAGHILGSAIVELWLTENGRSRKVVVSGDLGQPGRPIVRDPARIDRADLLLLESTYGDRNHKPLHETLDELVATLHQAFAAGKGVVLVPAFAVGRTQEFLYYLNQLAREGRIQLPQVYVDSPMATEVTSITARHFELFDEEARRLARVSTRDPSPLRVRYTQTLEESMALNRLTGHALIIAASGMCDGGRIRHHLKHHLSDPGTTVVIIGFQAAGTLGRRLVDRATHVRISGDEIPVRAQVVTLGGFSAHADQAALLGWLGHFEGPPAKTFLVHGEYSAATALAGRIQSTLHWPVEIPDHRETLSF
jgi:metallo-beta-lactamase family protein